MPLFVLGTLFRKPQKDIDSKPFNPSHRLLSTSALQIISNGHELLHQHVSSNPQFQLNLRRLDLNITSHQKLALIALSRPQNLCSLCHLEPQCRNRFTSRLHLDRLPGEKHVFIILLINK